MKYLYLIRHGKSSWEDSSLSDKDRPLKRRGVKNAKLMAKVLRGKGVAPELIISSPANRALSTAKIYADKLSFDEKKIAVNNLLYFEGVNNILKVVKQLDDASKTVFIFGHNPDFTEIANRFSDKTIDNVPTNGVVGIEFAADKWSEVSFTNGKLKFFDYPSNHK